MAQAIPPSAPGYTGFTILWRGHPSLWYFTGSIFWGLLLLPVGAGFFILLSAFLRWRANRYVIATTKVGTERGIFVTSTRELRIADIRSINIRRSGLAGFFGIGDVECSSAARDDASVIFAGVSSSEAVADVVRAIQDGAPPPPLSSSGGQSAGWAFAVFAALALVPMACLVWAARTVSNPAFESVQTVSPDAPAPPPAQHGPEMSTQLPTASQTPRSAPTPTPAAFAADVRYSQQAAVQKYPALTVAGSPLNALFLSRLNFWKARRDPRLDRSNWPEVLADDCAAHP